MTEQVYLLDEYIKTDSVSGIRMFSASTSSIYTSRQYIDISLITSGTSYSEYIEADSLDGNFGISVSDIDRTIGLFTELGMGLETSGLINDEYLSIDYSSGAIFISSDIEPIKAHRVYLSSKIDLDNILLDNYLEVDNYLETVVLNNTITKSTFISQILGASLLFENYFDDNYLSYNDNQLTRVLNVELEPMAHHRVYLSSKVSFLDSLASNYLNADNYAFGSVLSSNVERSIALFGEYELLLKYSNEFVDEYLRYSDYNIILIASSDIEPIKAHRVYLSSGVDIYCNETSSYLGVDDLSGEFGISVKDINLGEFFGTSLSTNILISEILLDAYLSADNYMELKRINVDLGSYFVLTTDLSSSINVTLNNVDSYLQTNSFIENIGLGVGQTSIITRKTNIGSSIGLTSNTTEGYIAYNNASEVKTVSSAISVTGTAIIPLISPVVTVVTKNICQEITLKITNNNNFAVQVYKDNGLLGTINANSNTNYRFSHALNGSGAGGGGTYTTTIKFVYQDKNKSTNFTTTISNICMWR